MLTDMLDMMLGKAHRRKGARARFKDALAIPYLTPCTLIDYILEPVLQNVYIERRTEMATSGIVP